MVVKIYISGISGNKEVKKRQQRVLMILDSKNVEYEIIDITEPGKELDKEFMQSNGNPRECKYPLPPQIFNEDEYCGDYEDFDLANEIDELEKFLKVASAVSSTEISLDSKPQNKDIQENGNSSSREPSTDKDAAVEQLESLHNDAPDLGETKDAIQEDDADQMEDSTNKNEGKSDDQEEKEE